MNMIMCWNHGIVILHFWVNISFLQPLAIKESLQIQSERRLVAGLEFGCAVQAGIKRLKKSIECSTLLPPTHARHVFFIKGFFATDKTILGYPRFLNCKEGQSTSFYIHEKGQCVANKFKD